MLYSFHRLLSDQWEGGGRACRLGVRKCIYSRKFSREQTFVNFIDLGPFVEQNLLRLSFRKPFLPRKFPVILWYNAVFCDHALYSRNQVSLS